MHISSVMNFLTQLFSLLRGDTRSSLNCHSNRRQSRWIWQCSAAELFSLAFCIYFYFATWNLNGTECVQENPCGNTEVACLLCVYTRCFAILNCSGSITTKYTKFFCHKASCLMHTNFAFRKVFHIFYVVLLFFETRINFSSTFPAFLSEEKKV